MRHKRIAPINETVNHVTADAAYDGNPTYQSLHQQFPNADLVIPPSKNAIENNNNEFHRNRNILEVKCQGQMAWQEKRDYGKRNQSKLGFSRYKRILGKKLHARDFSRQQQEAMIGCGILNKMTLVTVAGLRQKF